MAEYNAYVRLRRGGYQPVIGYDNFLYADQDVASGWYRDTGWIPKMLPVYEWIDFPVGTGDTLNYTVVAPATGTTATPDEQAGVAPRSLTWKVTRLSFRNAANETIAQFWVPEILGWSDSIPNSE